MGSHKIKTVDMSTSVEDADVKSTKKSTKTKAKPVVTEKSDKETKASATSKPQPKKQRSKRYQYIRSQVDKTKTYSLTQAVELVKKLSSKKHPTLTADINYKDPTFSGEVNLPYSTGKQIKVAIATDELLTEIQKGQINFDILVAEPAMMSKIAKHAKVLGPKGLMPNPKNNTVTKDPQKRKQELESGKTNLKSERKAPIIHIQIGSTAQPDSEIQANLEALIKFLNPAKISRLTLSSTMSPGVKIDLDSFSPSA